MERVNWMYIRRRHSFTRRRAHTSWGYAPKCACVANHPGSLTSVLWCVCCVWRSSDSTRIKVESVCGWRGLRLHAIRLVRDAGVCCVTIPCCVMSWLYSSSLFYLSSVFVLFQGPCSCVARELDASWLFRDRVRVTANGATRAPARQ